MARADDGGGVLLERESLTLLGSSRDSSTGFSTLDAASEMAVKGRKANFRLFLEKLEKRRKRIPCSYGCKIAVRNALMKIASPSGHVHYEDLREMQRSPPTGIDITFLKEFIGVSRAYDCTGDKQIDIFELLERALEVQPLMSRRMCVALQVALTVLWFSLSPLMYCYFADWTFLHALHFSVMIISTVGCTDVFSEHLGLKVFTLFYMLFGVALVSWILVSCVVSLIIRYENHVRSLFARRDMDLLADAGHGVSSRGPALEDLTCPGAALGTELTLTKGIQQRPGEHTKTQKQTKTGAAKARQTHHMRALDKAVACMGVMLALLLSGACLYYLSADDIDAPITDSFYWVIATCSTIGVSDLNLGGDDVQLGQGLALLFVVVAVPACAISLFELGEVHLQVCSAHLEAQAKARVLEHDALIDMDVYGVGVNQVEFLCAMLLALDKVSGSDLWHVLHTFAALDVDGSGVLDRHKLSALRRDVSKSGDMRLPEQRTCFPCLRRQQPRDEAQLPPTETQKAQLPPIETQKPLPLATPPLPVPTSAPSQARPAPAAAKEQTMLPRPLPEPGAPAVAIQDYQAPETLAAVATEAEGREDGPDGGASMSKTLLEDLYQENTKVRRQLDEKSEELLTALQSRQQLEQALRQVWAERQALHGELRLLKYKAAECQTRAESEVRRQEAAEARRTQAEQVAQDAERRVQEAERRRHESEQARIEAEQRATQAEQLRAEAEAKARQADERTEAAEQRSVEVVEKLRDAEQEWRSQNETKARELELKTAEMDMRRQGEVRSALLELQALAQGQQALRQEMHRVRPPPTYAYVAPSRSLGNSSHAQRLRSGQQPWEVWERASTWARDAIAQREAEAPQTALLSGRVREQIEFLDKQVRELERRHTAKDESVQPPGWV